MKIFHSVIAVLLIAGCASSNNSEKGSYSNLVELQLPKEQPNRPSKVYIDSVRQITRNKKNALVIHGTFPDGCTNLEAVTHHIKNDTLQLEFSAWRNPEMMCTQALTPFTFIYDKLSEEEISSHSGVVVNNTTYSY